jgi:cell division protein ZapA
MKKTNQGLSVRILEKEYQIACSDEERDDLIKASRYLESKLKEIAGKGKIIGSERAAIMAALNISYEMVKSQDIMGQQSSHEKRLEKLQSEVRGVVEKFRQSSI